MKAITTILDQQIDRKGFIKQLGLGTVMLFGGGLVARTLMGGQAGRKSNGYGSSAYGGK